tara:strand:- start:176 stop:511 length:336 start_codon:yes stop_codon:yes gene_type:complete
MPLRIIYFLIFYTFIVIFFNSCSSVKDAFDPQRKNSSEEFLVEKKSPLSMPPNFNELPLPQDKINNNETAKDNVKNLILAEENDAEVSSKNSNINTDTDLEKSILDQINNN